MKDVQRTEQAAPAAVRGMYRLFLGNTTYTLLLALAAIIVGRILGPDGYGLYTIAIIIPPFLFNAARLGLDTAATRYAARLKSEAKEREATLFVHAMILFEVGLALVFTLVFFGLSGILASRVLNRPDIAGLILPLAMLSVVGQAAYTVTTSGLIGLGKYGTAAILQAVQGLTKLVVSVGLVLLGFGVTGAVAGYTVSFYASGLLGAILVMGISSAGLPKGMKTDFNTAVGYGWPVYLSILASGFVAPAINTTLALTVSNSQIGGYSAAATFGSLIALFTYPIGTALFPLFSRKVSNDLLGGTYRASVWFTGLLVVPVASFVMAFSGPLIVTFYGKVYAFGATYLALFAAIYLFAGVGSLAWSALLTGIGQTRDALISTALGSVASVVSAIGLIQFFGVAGAVAGQVVGTGAQLVLGTWMVKRRLGVGLEIASAWKVYSSAVLTAAICYPFSSAVTIPQISLAIGAVVYLAMFIAVLAVFKTMDKEALGSLRAYLGFSPVVSKPLEVGIRYYEFVARATRGG